MPLEVRQIGIQMQVGDAGDAGGQGQGGAPSALDLLPNGDDDRERAQLIEQCVEAVLAELARRSER
jgi:hypothetical protein